MPLIRDERIGWTARLYAAYRATLGVYLLVHFAHLTPWAAELFSSQGLLPDASASPLAYAFPNILSVFDSPGFVLGLMLAACLASLLLVAGVLDRVAAVLLWYIWACLLGRNPLILNPGLPYVGWLLLAHAFMPAMPVALPWRRDAASHAWRMPASIYTIAWVLMALGYSYSGYTKFISPSWIDGTAVARVLENPLARPTALREWVLNWPTWLLAGATWGALAFELSFAPLALFRVLRPWVWLGAAVMHVALMTLLTFADLSLGMLMLHVFTFNPAWVGSRRGGGHAEGEVK